MDHACFGLIGQPVNLFFAVLIRSLFGLNMLLALFLHDDMDSAIFSLYNGYPGSWSPSLQILDEWTVLFGLFNQEEIFHNENNKEASEN